MRAPAEGTVRLLPPESLENVAWGPAGRGSRAESLHAPSSANTVNDPKAVSASTTYRVSFPEDEETSEIQY